MQSPYDARSGQVRRIYPQRWLRLRDGLWSKVYDMDFGSMFMVLKGLHVSMNACSSFYHVIVPLMAFMTLLLLNTHDSYARFLPIILARPCGSCLFASFQVRVRLRKMTSQVDLEAWGRSVYIVVSN